MCKIGNKGNHIKRWTFCWQKLKSTTYNEDENNDATLDSDNSRIAYSMQDSSIEVSCEKDSSNTNSHVTSTPIKYKRRFNPFEDGFGETFINNGDSYNESIIENGDSSISYSLLISEAILREILENIGIGVKSVNGARYDDTKNPFMDV